MNNSISQRAQSAFDSFYSNPSPIGALNLAISDAIHGKQSEEFYRELVRARDMLSAHDALVSALKEARYDVQARAQDFKRPEPGRLDSRDRLRDIDNALHLANR